MEVHMDEFRLINIDVPHSSRNPLITLLTASLVAINSLLDLASHTLDNFLSYIGRILALPGRIIGNARGRHYQIPLASSRRSAREPRRTQFSNQYPPGWDDTEAQIILPHSYGPFDRPSSYLLFFDFKEDSALISELRVINIAGGKDGQVSDSIRLIQKLKTWSLREILRALLSLYESTLKLVVIDYNDFGGFSYRESDFTSVMQQRGDNWIIQMSPGIPFPDPPLSRHVLELLFRADPYIRDEMLCSKRIPQRVTPLSNAELPEELRKGPICGFTVSKRLSVLRVLCLFFIGTMIADSPLCLLLFPVSDSQSSFTFDSSYCYVIWLAMLAQSLFAISADTIICRLNISKQKWNIKAGVFQNLYRCTCGERLMGERKINIRDPTALAIYRFVSSLRRVEQPQLEDSITSKVIPKSTSIPEESPGNQAGPLEGSGPTCRTDSLSGNGLGTGEEASKSCESKSRGESSVEDPTSEEGEEARKDKDEKSPQKFLIICFPSPNGHKMKHLKILKEVADQALIKYIKSEYFRNRPGWRRFLDLRGFSDIRLARFELAHTPTSRVPTDIDWEWPSEVDRDWEWEESQSSPITIDGISKFMVHLWTDKCGKKSDSKEEHTKHKGWIPRIELHWSNRVQTLRLGESSMSNAPFPWLRLASSIRIYFPDQKAPAQAEEVEVSEELGMQWLQNASIEIDFGHNLVHPRFISQRTPKKLHKPLEIDPNGMTAPIGWAIWIDEDFSVPWHVPFLLTLISIGIFVFAVWYTADHGPKVNGWTIGSFLLTPLSLVFTAWVLRTKDSKHARA